MSEPLAHLDTEGTNPLADPDAELARRNLQFGWALLGMCILLFVGTVGVAFVYLWLS